MRSYVYRARDKRGRPVRGEVAAVDLRAAKKKVAADGLIVLSVKDAGYLTVVNKAKNFLRDFGKDVKTEDIIMFNRQMQIVYSVGIPIMQGMQMVLEQTVNVILKRAIAEILKDISEGLALNEAMAKHEEIFDPVYVNLIRVGEATGELQTMLEKASELIEERSEQKQKVNSAMFYPKLVVSFLCIVLLIVVYGVLPRLKTFFEGFGGELPLITRIVMGTSDFFVSYWYLVGSVGAGIYFGSKALLRKPKYRYKLDALILKLPIIGILLLQIEVNTFCSILEILLKSGVSIVEAFTHVERSSGNKVFATDIANCRKTIEKGGGLGPGLHSAKVFPSLVSGLISMGEEGGSLPAVLKQISSYYKIQINHRLNNLSKLIEPIMLFFIFGMVLILALAVFLPMWKMSSAAKH
jgi:MSHA biogenesis protein MshG